MTKIKPQQLQAQKAGVPAIKYDNVWLEAAEEAGGGFGKILKFNKGDWLVGEDEVPEGKEYIVYIDETARGWVKFVDKTPVNRTCGLRQSP